MEANEKLDYILTEIEKTNDLLDRILKKIIQYGPLRDY